MSTVKKIVGQITLKALTDVESTTYYYLLQSSIAPAPSIPTTNPPGSGWSTTEPEFFTYIPTQDTSVVSGKDYYTRSGSAGNYTYTIVSNPTGNPSTNSYYEKIYGDTRSLYVTVQTLYTDTTFEYSTPSLSSSYEAAKEAYNRAKTALDLAGDINQYFWALSSSYSTDVPAGVYVTNIPQNQFKSAPAQGNILMQSAGLTIRNGAIPLASLTGTALNFYNPTTHESNATLSSEGLVLSKGGIRVNTVGSNNGIYIFSDNLGSSIPLDNNIKTNWRAVIGSKFGVDSEGNLYANNAHLSSANVEGAITATSLTIGSGANSYNGIAAINISGYDIEITSDSTGVVDEENTTYLYPVLYHNGNRVEEYILSTDTTVDVSKTYYTRSGSEGSYIYTIVSNPTGNPHTNLYYEEQIHYDDFIWYKDDIEPGTAGDANNQGRYLATYGHNYRVVYDFDDGAVGGGTQIQTRTIDPSKYITKINDTGITIHPEVWTNQSSYIQLDGTGMELFNSSGSSIAKYGSSTRIGLNSSSRFLINNNSLQAYDNNNNKYFEVNNNNLSWGNNTAATTADLEDAAKTATNYITTIDGGGIKVHDVNDEDNYAKIDSNGLKFYNDDVSIAEFGASGSQIGQAEGAHTVIDEDGMQIYSIDSNDNLVQLANIGYGPGIDNVGGTSDAPYYTLGIRVGSIGNYSTVEGYNIIASGFVSHAEGDNTTASGTASHAEGSGTTASGTASHAEGSATASGTVSHAEGSGTTASGSASHAEGFGTTAGGTTSHAEGDDTTASGVASHAQNTQTIASKNSQTAIGTFNIEDTSSTTTHPSGIASYGKYSVIIGNGKSSARSNALTVDWNGNVEAAGGITVNGHSSPIGTVYYNSASTAISNTAIDNNTNGASISVPAGTYIVIGQWQFNTRSSSGVTNSAVRLYRSGSSNNIAQTRVTAANEAWNCLQCSAVVTLTETETLSVCGATSRAYSSAQTNWITAIRIA